MSRSFLTVDMTQVDITLPFESGFSDAMSATTEEMKDAAGDASRDFPASYHVDRKDYAVKSEENNTLRTWPLNYVDRFTNQDPTHECTCHSLSRNAEGCRNRQRAIIFKDGPKKEYRYPESATSGSVWLSPLSNYAIANPQRWGGANVRAVLKIMMDYGMLPDKIQPREYGFKHTLTGTSGKGNMNQSGGEWIPVSRFPEGWKETAALFKPLEVIFPTSVDEIICLVLHGLLVSVGRNGHAIPYAIYDHEKDLLGYIDSYNIVRWDSRRTAQQAVGGAFAIASMTTPADWNNPAATSLAA